MVATVLAVQTVVRAGITPAYTAANVDGHNVDNSTGGTLLHVKNADASPMTVTIDTPGSVDGLAIADREIIVPATDEMIIGPFPTGAYGTTLLITFSAVTSLTCAALKY